MKRPPYQSRSKRELQRALRWGLKACNLRNWDAELFVDDEADDNEDLKDLYPAQAGVVRYKHDQHAVVGLWNQDCQRHGIDPVANIFHEVTHVLLNEVYPEKLPHLQYDAWERLCNRIAIILFQLWERR